MIRKLKTKLVNLAYNFNSPKSNFLFGENKCQHIDETAII